MVRLILESADNGVVKVVEDDNINGAGAPFNSKSVYEFTNDSTHKHKIKFFYDLAEDLGINIGNIYDADNLVMNSDWGLSYKPTKGEVLDKIDKYKLIIQHLENTIKTPKK